MKNIPSIFVTTVVLFLGLPGLYADRVSQHIGPLLDTPASLSDAYRGFREEVWRLTPPIQTAEADAKREESGAGTWFQQRWSRWLAQPSWFIPHRMGPDRIAPALQEKLWPKGHVGAVWVWENPGEALIYLSRENSETGGMDLLAELPAPTWEIRRGETAQVFYDRQIATRRVAWIILSPHAEPEPEPAPRMMMGAGPPQFRVILEHADPENLSGRVEFGMETTPGPFTVWRHDHGIPNGWEHLPGHWFPIVWERDRGSEPAWDFSMEASGAGETHPLFLRATLGMVDSDNDGMDDGWELWHFGQLLSPTGDQDGDGLSNLLEYLNSTDPNSPDTDGDGLSDGDEILLGRDPHYRDHPEVGLEVNLVY